MTAGDLCLYMKDERLLAKPTHGHIIRLAPPLIITETQIDYSLDCIRKAVKKFSSECN